MPPTRLSTKSSIQRFFDPYDHRLVDHYPTDQTDTHLGERSPTSILQHQEHKKRTKKKTYVSKIDQQSDVAPNNQQSHVTPNNQQSHVTPNNQPTFESATLHCTFNTSFTRCRTRVNVL